MLIDQYGARLPDPGEQRLAEDAESRPDGDAFEGDWILPVAAWRANADTMRARIDAGQLRIILELDGADTAVVSEFATDLPRFKRLDIRFPGFADGRGYSLGVLLRTRHHYRGGLRGIGVEADNLPALRQCGYDSFELDAELEPALIREILNNAGTPHALSLGTG